MGDGTEYTSNHIDLESAKDACRRAGYAVIDDTPETPDEKLDRLYQDFALLASRIIVLLDKGARLPSRETRWVLPMNTVRIVKAARKAEESVL